MSTSTPTPPAGLFAEGETATPFTPKDGDRYATARTTREYAIVRPDGFLARIGYGSGIGSRIAFLKEQGVDVPVVVSRFVGDEQWWTLTPEMTVPDSLPANFQ